MSCLPHCPIRTERSSDCGPTATRSRKSPPGSGGRSVRSSESCRSSARGSRGSSMIAADASNAVRADPALELDAFVAAFEAAASGGAAPDPGSFLPPRDHPLYDSVLRELVRVDLEFAWSRGTRRRVEDYRDRFPELFRD